MARRAIIIGAGPAGLTAALELLRQTDVVPIVLEASEEIGGISRTICYKGNRMDIGGHRFFSKSDRVMQWWMDLMPPEIAAVDSVDVADAAAPEAADAAEITYQGKRRVVAVPARLPEEPVLRGIGPIKLVSDTEELGPDGELDAQHTDRHSGHTETLVAAAPVSTAEADRVMLIRPRKSRIFYLRQFFDYPIRLTAATLRALGFRRTVRVGVSYLWSRVRKITPERSLEDFLINRFGRELYLTFFKSYTEKVWGTACSSISAEWGAQRIKGLSLTTAVRHFLRRSLPGRRQAANDLAQKGTDTSLIERFLYPKFGPGQLWEHVADLVEQGGGELLKGWTVDRVCCAGERVVAIEAVHTGGERRRFEGEYFFSTMPIKDLVRAMDCAVPETIREISEGLEYRDFITVGLLAKRLRLQERDGGLLRDTWIYVQEPDVQLGRLQIFNNWSPYLVADPATVWIGLEYFCYDTDPLWGMEDAALQRFAIGEVEKIGILEADAVLDGHVVRVPKTYPAYFGTYSRFDELRGFLDRFENLILVGRNGMHKYNNQDHSMLTAMTAVDAIARTGRVDKAALWGINTEQEYHEEKR